MVHLRLVHSAPSSVPLGHPCLEAFAGELDYIHQSLCWLGASAATMEDLAHEVFLRLERSWPKARASERLRPHLFGIAFRVMQRHARRAGRLSAASVWPDEIARQRRRGVSVGLGNDRLDLLQAALARVALLRRAVLVLHEIDGVSIPEIAVALSMSKWTARWRLRLARRDLTAAVRYLTTNARRS